ncbi:MAG: class I SAM-dependent methyltransferase [Deltaproteobacteria bacterium]|nr:class I SAM-dependent methyltransferase [Deltaproteobacteria bacterium]
MGLLALVAVGSVSYNVVQHLRHADLSARLAEASRPPPPPSEKEVLRLFYEQWIPLQKPTVWQNQWLGVGTLQNPFDVWVTQEIFFEVRPDFVVETGTLRGGSAAVFSTILEQINPDARVISIDIEDMAGEAKKLPIVQKRVDFLLGSSTDPKIVNEVKARVAGKKVVVILDSLHTRDHVLAELEAYAPIVNVGSYLIVQDTFVNGHPAWLSYGPGPHEAVEAFLSKRNDFVVDKNRERLMFTFSVDGWLKRVK